jgi:hypothetical protein
MKHKMQEVLLKHSSLYALNVVIFQSKTVQNMVKTLFNLNVNFAVVLHSGFVGVTLISVNLVIKGNAMEIM